MPRNPKKAGGFLDFVIRPHGFETDFSDEDVPEEVSKTRSAFLSDPARALYDIGFLGAEPWYSPSLAYLHKVSSAFVDSLPALRT